MAKNNLERERRMSNQIKQIAAEFLRYDSKDPVLELLTITDVRMTGDLQNATIFWTHHKLAKAEEKGADESAVEQTEAEIQKVLNKLTGRVRTQLAQKLGTRLAPTVRFEVDHLGANVASVEDLLQQASARDAKLEAERKEAKYASEENPYKEIVDHSAKWLEE